MALTFALTLSSGTVRNLQVISYTITSEWFGHASLILTISSINYLNHGLDEASRIKVTAPDGTVIFLGFFEKSTGGNFGSTIPPPEHVLMWFGSFSKLLEMRSAYPATYPTTTNLYALLDDTPGTRGLLYEASSLIPDGVWGNPTAPNYLFESSLLGSQVISSPVLYKGTALMTRSGSSPPPVDQFYQGLTHLQVRFATSANPFTYPLYLTDLRNTYIKRDTSVSDKTITLLGPVTLGPGSNYWSVLKTLFRSQDLEWVFVDNANGYTYLKWATYISRGSLVSPYKTYTEGVDVMDFTFGSEGFRSTVTVVGASGLIKCEPSYVSALHYKEGLYFEPTLTTQAQVDAYAGWLIRHVGSSQDTIAVKAAPDYTLNVGDYIGIDMKNGENPVSPVYKLVHKDGLMYLYTRHIVWM